MSLPSLAALIVSGGIRSAFVTAGGLGVIVPIIALMLSFYLDQVVRIFSRTHEIFHTLEPAIGSQHFPSETRNFLARLNHTRSGTL